MVKRIPDIIHQISNDIEIIDNNIKYHNYTVESCRKFILEHSELLGNDVLKLFDTYIPSKCKMNLFKYCVLYVKGGFFIENKADISHVKTLFHSVENDIDLLLCDDVQHFQPVHVNQLPQPIQHPTHIQPHQVNSLNMKQYRFEHNNRIRHIRQLNQMQQNKQHHLSDINTNIIGSSPLNPIIKECINECINRYNLNFVPEVNGDPTNKKMFEFILNILDDNTVSHDRKFSSGRYRIHDMNINIINSFTPPHPHDGSQFMDLYEKKSEINAPIKSLGSTHHLVNGIKIKIYPPTYENYISVSYSHHTDKSIQISVSGRTLTVKKVTVSMTTNNEIKNLPLSDLLINPIVTFTHPLNIVSVDYVQKIPKKIYFFTEYTPILNLCRDTFARLNPEYDIELYNEFTARKMIEDNMGSDVLLAYDVINQYAYKCDLWRCCVLYIHGGIYLDDKLFGLVPFRNFIRPHDNFMLTVDFNPNSMFNGIMAFTKGHPMLKLIISNIVDNILQKRKLALLQITGPAVVGSSFGTYFNNRVSREKGSYSFNNEFYTLIKHQPIIVNNRNSLRDTDLFFVDTFGQKVIHKYFGSYKPHRKFHYSHYFNQNQSFNTIDKTILHEIKFDYDYCFEYDRSVHQDLFQWRTIKCHNRDAFLILIQRTDSPVGWGQFLNLTLNGVTYPVGSSDNNIKCMVFETNGKIIDIDQYPDNIGELIINVI